MLLQTVLAVDMAFIPSGWPSGQAAKQRTAGGGERTATGTGRRQRKILANHFPGSAIQSE